MSYFRNPKNPDPRVGLIREIPDSWDIPASLGKGISTQKPQMVPMDYNPGKPTQKVCKHFFPQKTRKAVTTPERFSELQEIIG